MKTNISKLVLAVVVVLALQTMLLAAAPKNIDVSATVETLNGQMEVAIHKVNPTGNVWDPAEQPSVDFGLLERDRKFGIFTGKQYYAVDVSVLDNTGKGWTLSHTTSSVKNGAETLDASINVVFAKEMYKKGKKPDGTPNDPDETILDPLNFKDSNNKQYNRAILEGGKGGWLRIYYGIATGNEDKTLGSLDAPGSEPIALYQLAGAYKGGVTITLTPQ